MSTVPMSSIPDHSQSQRKEDKFREYRPYARGNAARITDEQWEPFFLLIRTLHNARRTRVQILEVLRDHGLEPSVAQLYAKMSKWGLKGYGAGTTAEENTVDTITCTTVEAGGSLPVCQHQYDTQRPQTYENSSEDSQESSDSANCFSDHDVDTSDTVYDTEGPPAGPGCEDDMIVTTAETDDAEEAAPPVQSLDDLIKADASSSTVDSTDGSSLSGEVLQKLPSDLMAFVYTTGDISDYDQHDILNEVASFLCATSSFSDAFVLFDACHTFLKDNCGTPMSIVFATINCLRSATFKEQCQYAGALMGEALAALRLLSYTNPYAATAFSSLEVIGRELCVRSQLDYLNILYNQIQFREATFSACAPSRTSTNEILLHCSDPFLLAKADDCPELLAQSMDVNGLVLGRIVGKLSRWCCTAIDDFNPVSMLPSAGFNPSDTVSVARFSTALSCHFVRKWSFLSLADVLGHCNELLPPNRKDAAARLCKLAVRVLSTLAVYTIYQATGTTLRSVSVDNFITPENQSQYVSPLASHLDTLSRMGNKERIVVFAEMHKTLYNRTLVYRQQLDDHCLTAHVRETGFLLAASLIRLKRELNTEVPRPAREISRASTPRRHRDSRSRSRSRSRSPSRKSRDSSSSMRNLARRNLLVPGIMSKNGSHMRPSWTRRLSTDSHESWNFTKVTGLPAGPTPPGSVREPIHNEIICDTMEMDVDIDLNDDIDMNMF